MFHGVKPEHFGLYIDQANDRLDTLDGESWEQHLRRTLLEYCTLNTVAQTEIDYLLSLIPEHASPQLHSIYGLQTLIRARHALRELLGEGMGPTEALMAQLQEDGVWEPEGNDMLASDTFGLWSNFSKTLDEDIRQSAFRTRELGEDEAGAAANYSMVRLEDFDDPEECFNIARRRLSVGIFDACTGNTSISQYRAVVSDHYPRLNPVFMTGIVTRDMITSVTAGLIEDINALPFPGGPSFRDEAA